jgi:hypothetical protein
MSYESVYPIDSREKQQIDIEAYKNPVTEIQKIPGLPKNFFNAAACKLDEDPPCSK